MGGERYAGQRLAPHSSGFVRTNWIAEETDMAERDDRDRDRDHREHHRCRPFFGNLRDRIELIKRSDDDEAREVLRTIIEAAFYQGVACCCMECKCEEHEEKEKERDRDRD
jgi:hypothetical protein